MRGRMEKSYDKEKRMRRAERRKKDGSNEETDVKKGRKRGMMRTLERSGKYKKKSG